MKKCPHCKLLNPDSAERCDCGYDFDTKALKKPYFRQEMPKYVMVSLFALVVLAALRALVTADPYAVLASLLLAGSIYALYAQLLKKKHRARVALMILTFPIGTVILLTPEVKLFMAQKDS